MDAENNLEALPDDMLHEIARQLDRRSLLRLAVVSHSMKKVVEGVEDERTGGIINNIEHGIAPSLDERNYLQGKLNQRQLEDFLGEPPIYIPQPLRQLAQQQVNELSLALLDID